MDDPDLAAIRAARMRELRAGAGGGGGGEASGSAQGLPAGLSLGGGGGGRGGAQDEEAQARQQEQMEEQKRQLLSTVLDAQARERREWPRGLDARAGAGGSGGQPYVGAPPQPCSCDPHSPVSRIAMVKPQKARAIQDLILRMAQSGQVRQRITEEQLIGLLQQVEGGQEAQGKIMVRA